MKCRFCGQWLVTVKRRSNKTHQRRLTGLIGTVDDIEPLWIKSQQQIAPDAKTIDVNFCQLHAEFLCQTSLPATPRLVIGFILFRVVINVFRIDVCRFVKVPNTVPLFGCIRYDIDVIRHSNLV